MLSFSIISFRRSGLKGLRIMTYGLAFQCALTTAVLALSLETNWFEELDWWAVPLFDVLVLVFVLAASTAGGRSHERST